MVAAADISRAGADISRAAAVTLYHFPGSEVITVDNEEDKYLMIN